MKNRDGQFQLANRAAAEAYGTTVEDIIGKTDADFNPHPEEVEAFRRDDLEVINTCSTKYIPEEKVTDSTGHVRWLSTVKVPLIEQDGSCSRVLYTTHDITARKEAEEALAREQAFIASAIELLPFPIIFNTLTGEVLRANQAAYRFFGDVGIDHWWRRELLNSTTREPIPREEWPLMRAARDEVVPAMEGIMLLPDGREVDVLAVAAPVHVDERLAATAVAFMDITPIKEADRAKTRFLAILSHELRTPLANILGWVKQVQETPEVFEDALGIIRRNADAQRRMLERLLEISRLFYGKFDLHRHTVNLWQVVAEVAQSLRSEVEARDITLNIQAPPVALPVYGDTKRLREAIESVLDNALNFTTVGGHILLRGRRIDRQAEIVILNTGCGIPPEVLPHVFEIFQLPPEIANTGGSLGLGLPLAKVILDQHGGQITIASAGAGQECTVTITLPLEDAMG